MKHAGGGLSADRRKSISDGVRQAAKSRTAVHAAAVDEGRQIGAAARRKSAPNDDPPNILTCSCGTTFVAGWRELVSGRELRCSLCRGDAVRRLTLALVEAAPAPEVEAEVLRMIDHSEAQAGMWQIHPEIVQ